MTVTTAAPAELRDALGRLRVVSVEPLEGATKYVGEFDYRDVRGHTLTGRGKFYLPATPGPHPLLFAAGYEIAPDDLALHEVRNGWLVVNPVSPDPEQVWPGDNPLGRSINLDVALLHIARSLPQVDDARVVLGGGSAGGWMALMLAAESFPLAGVGVQVAPLNWGYNAAYSLRNNALGVPALQGAATLAEWGVQMYGPDTASDVWWQHSPVAHVARITTPVHIAYTTADVLVPVDQVAARLAKPPQPGGMPAGYATDPGTIGSGRLTVRLADVVPDAEIQVLPLPAGAVRLDEADRDEEPTSVVLPAGHRRWSIYVLDEGPPDRAVGHVKHSIAFDRTAFMQRVRDGALDPRQATIAKLEVLAARYEGREWIDGPVPHLDLPEAERYDVERAMRTFRQLRGGAEALRGLPDDLVNRLP
jgi:hypothetical protein